MRAGALKGNSAPPRAVLDVKTACYGRCSLASDPPGGPSVCPSRAYGTLSGPSLLIAVPAEGAPPVEVPLKWPHIGRIVEPVV